MAVGSYKEEYSNQVFLIQLQKDEFENGQFIKICEFDHPYPATKVMFAPRSHTASSPKDLLATTGDYLRLWSVDPENKNKVEMKAILNNNKHTGGEVSL